MVKRNVRLTLLLGLLLISGCSSPYVDNNTIEEIAPVIFWSIKDGGEGKLKISTLVPPLVNEKKRLITLKVDLLKQGGKNFNFVYYRELKTGQLRMLFISEELARKGTLSLINTILTDPDISHRLYLVIVKGDFEEFIKNQIKKEENLDYYLYRMFKHYENREQGEMTIINLHQFMKELYSPYKSPILPTFNATKENLAYDGTALFRGDQLVATVKNINDQIIQLIDNDHFLKLLTIPDLSIVIGEVRSNPDIVINLRESSISVKVDLNCRIEEYRGDKDIFDKDQLAELNHEVESYMENKTEELLKRMQKWKVDPLHFGTHLLTPFSKPITEKEWLKYWEKMKVKVDYQLHLQPITNVHE